jgi:hypothetical protein
MVLAKRARFIFRRCTDFWNRRVGGMKCQEWTGEFFAGNGNANC